MKFNFGKLALFWQNIPKKTKVISLLFLIFLLILYPVKKFLIAPKTDKKEVPSTMVDADWQKYQVLGVEAPFFDLKPTTQSGFGVLPKETFILSTASAVDSDFIKKNLVTNASYDLKQLTETSFEIKVKGAPTSDELLSFSFPVKEGETESQKYKRNYNWAFQVQPKFGISSVLPGDQKTSVPLNSGIEIVFNQDGYRDPTNYFSITPNITWRSEKRGNTFSIVPLEPLKSKTVYTVTLKKGLDLEQRSDPMAEDFSFSFQTEEGMADKSLFYLSLSKDIIQTSTREAPAVTVYASNKNEGVSIKTKIFKFADSSQFIQSRKKLDEAANYWYHFYYDGVPVETKNLAKISEADLKIESQNEVDFLKLPEALPAGYYLVQFWYNDSKTLEQLWIQSTDISAYTSVGRRQTLVWANELISGGAINGATISTENSDVIAYTSADGVSAFNTPKSFFEKSNHYLKVSSDGRELVLPVKSLKEELSAEDISPDDFWSYLYHERSLYKTGDTFYFWGVLKDRNSGQIPADAEVVISEGYGYYGSKKLASVKIYPEGDGTFIGNLPLTETANGYYQVSVEVRGKRVAASYFRVSNYQKPELKIEITSNKKAIFTDEKVEFTAKVGFFDGTPAKNIPLNIYLGEGGESISVKTNKNGIIKYTYSPTYKEKYYYDDYPRYESITIKPALVNDDNLAAYGSVLVYGEKLTLDSSSKQEGKEASVKATVNRVILDNLNQNKSTETKGELVANQEISLLVTKKWWDKVEEGTYYDFIEKVTRKSYRYTSHEEKITETTLKTNQDGQINHQFEMEEGKSYLVALSIKDKDGHPVKASEYLYYYKGEQSGSENQYSQPEFVLSQKENKFSLGDQVDLSIQYQDKDYPDNPQNRFLYILSQNGRQDFFVKDSPKFNFEFSQKNVPNVYASAIIFTGQYYQITIPSYNNDDYYWGNYYDDTYFNSLYLDFENEDNKLNINIASDKDKYGPGDKATVRVKVKKGEEALPGAKVNLVLVDQAMEAIGGVIKPSVLENLYTSISNQIYYNYYSHKPISYKPPAAEKGGGGGGEDREVFKDTPFFDQGRTNENGEVTFEIQLPDNITTWLIYAQAMTGDFYAGQAESSLVATKGFFVTSNYPPEFLTRDSAFVSGNGFGAEVEPNQNISYEVKVLEGEREISNFSGQGKSSADTQFKLPQLPVGDYKVSVKGSLGNQVDGLTQPFKVIQSRVKFETSKSFEVDKGKTIKALDLPGINESLPVKLVVSDIGYGKYFHQLNDYCYSFSNRIEKQMAKVRANKIMEERFGSNYCPVPAKELSVYQNSDGGLSQVVWGGSELATTVWSIYVDSSPFDKEKLISYLENKLENTSIKSFDKIYALWGLSILGEPKLTQLKNMASTASTFFDQVTIGLALASQGDLETSRRLYDGIIANYAFINKPYMRIQADQLNEIDNTSLILLLGSLLDSELNKSFYLYLDHYSGETDKLVHYLARIAYLDSEMSDLPQEKSQVILSSPGFNQTINLSKGRSKIITLPGSNIKNTKIETTAGKAEINSLYYLSAESLAQIKRDERLSISRKYNLIEPENDLIYPGNVINVQIKYDFNSLAPESCYTITDYLPSGFSFISNPKIMGQTSSDWAYEKSKNVVEYWICNNKWWRLHDDGVLNYYATASAVGTYTAEPAIIQSRLDLSIIQTTGEDTVKIDAAK